MKIARLLSLLLILASLGCRNNKSQPEIQSLKDSATPDKTETAKIINTISLDSFKFKSDAITYGCADIYLQKFSRDFNYEILIDIQIDSIPKFEEIDVNKYSKFIKIYFNQYSKENKYIDPICNDNPRFPTNWKEPEKYSIVSGKLKITEWSDKNYIISAFTTNLIFMNKHGAEVILPLEYFNQLETHTYGG